MRAMNVRDQVRTVCAQHGWTVANADPDQICQTTGLPRKKVVRALWWLRTNTSAKPRRTNGKNGHGLHVAPGSAAANLLGFHPDTRYEQRFESLAQFIGIAKAEDLLKNLRARLQEQLN